MFCCFPLCTDFYSLRCQQVFINATKVVALSLVCLFLHVPHLVRVICLLSSVVDVAGRRSARSKDSMGFVTLNILLHRQRAHIKKRGKQSRQRNARKDNVAKSLQTSAHNRNYYVLVTLYSTYVGTLSVEVVRTLCLTMRLRIKRSRTFNRV